MVKDPPANAGDMSSIPGSSGKMPQEAGVANPLQYSCLEKSHGQRILAGLRSKGTQRVRHSWVTELKHMSL